MIALKPVGNTPALAITKLQVRRDKSLGEISNILRTKLALKPGESVFFYIRSSFAPTPDSRMNDLFEVSFCLL